ncbi:MAG: hypothetical protein LHW46_08125 [Candidatus Cloacimonetes bacterium]|jgi:hypothetical protein|nr:hypothetical protein [Candidatus Cloacimonadota bacterium]MDY0337733.1 hypothetical protein [Candidatus Cloacimonadaceae bacterium]MCK9335767.1 hypothetical protein [Candidatus Cloacimonadota bacterium]MDD2544461.1 hypothetical protein [Candidatus Cloacimonadota bacterium]MDD2684125.1 hypothetical protein [Candidatus Cloacimonadota bacterium]
MKKFSYLLVVILIALLFSLSACGGDDDNDGDLTEIPEITPDNFDWDVYIVDVASSKPEVNYYVSVDWLGNPAALIAGDQISIKFGDQEAIILQNMGFGGYWFYAGMAQLNPGTSYNIKLFKNDDQQASVNIKTPYRAYASFPSFYNPSTSAEITWSLEHDNQFQVAGVSSYDADYEESDDDLVWLDPSERSHTIPANAVQNYGEDTEYEMLVLQYSFAQNNRSAFMIAQGQGRTYPDDPVKTADFEQTINQLRKLRRSL